MSLKKDHLNLYRRVQLKSLINILLGLSLVFVEPKYIPSASATFLQPFGLIMWGMFFLVIGTGLSISNFFSKDNYKWVKLWLGVSVAYSTIWLVALINLLFHGHWTTLTTAILWAYFTYNQYYILQDNGWRAVGIKQRIDKVINGNGQHTL